MPSSTAFLGREFSAAGRMKAISATRSPRASGPAGGGKARAFLQALEANGIAQRLA